MSSGRGSFTAQKCAVPGVTIVHARSAHSFPPHMHDEFGLGVIRRGAQRSRSGRGTIEAGAGDLITCNPGEVHDGHAIGGERSWSMIYLDPSLVQRTAEQVAHQSMTFEFTRPHFKSAPLAQSLDRLLAALTNDADGAYWSFEEQLIGLIAKLSLIIPRLAPGEAAAVHDVLTRIDADPNAPASLSCLARSAGLSAFALIRAFRTATGLTPHAYVTQRRLQMARRLLASRMPIAEAAVAAGFSDQAHLTRLFARTYGITPGSFVRARC